MNTAYCVLTNEDLLREITKWHILKYISFPDIFLSIVTDDKNIHQLKFLLRDKFVTFESLFKMLKPQLDHHDDYNKNFNIKSPVNIGSFIEYLFWKADSFELFKYIFNNYDDERNKILNLDILKTSPLKSIMACANFNQKDIWMKKLNLIMVYKELDMSEPVHTVAGVFMPLLGHIGNPEGYEGTKIGKEFDIICDAPDRNCGKIINNFGDVLKHIPLDTVEKNINNDGMHVPVNMYHWDNNNDNMHQWINNDDDDNGPNYFDDDDNDGPNLFMN